MRRKRRRQAFKLAPWRGQLQSAGSAMLWVVALLLVGGMYLAVSAKVARAGRMVLALEDQRRELQRSNAELSARLAELTSPEILLGKADGMGFRPARPEEIEYLTVEGYVPEAPFVAPRPPAATSFGDPRLSPA